MFNINENVITQLIDNWAKNSQSTVNEKDALIQLILSMIRGGYDRGRIDNGKYAVCCLTNDSKFDYTDLQIYEAVSKEEAIGKCIENVMSKNSNLKLNKCMAVKC